MKRYSIFIIISITLSIILLYSCAKEFPKPLAPVANFSYIKQTPNAPCTIIFSNTSENATTYSWDLGDGTTSDAPDLSHKYMHSGTYNVKLTASGNRGKNTVSQTITIGVTNPLSSFTFEMNQQNSPIIVTFTNISQNSISYKWDFGDGETSVDSNPLHTYIQTGVFTISLIANGLEGSDTSTQLIYIGAAFTKAYIKKVIVLNLPFINTVTNSTWDIGSGPDIYFKITNNSHDILYALPIIDRIDDVTQGMLPVSWDLTNPYWQIPSISSAINFEFYDYDAPGTDQYMNWCTGFKISDYPNYPLSITKSWMNYTVKIYLLWQ